MALYTHLSKKQVEKLAGQFGLPPPKKIRGILEGTVNTFYRLDYPHTSYFLKIDEVADRKRLLREIEVFRTIRRISKKLPCQIAAPLPTTKENFFVPFGKKFVLLFPALEGKTATYKSLNSSKLKTIGRVLAQFHNLTRNTPLPPHRFDRTGQEKVYKEIEKKLKKKYPWINLFISQWMEILKKEEPHELPSGLIHADLFAENILFKGNRLAGFIDFEAAGRGPFLFDVGVCLHALCAKGKKFDQTRCRAFLKGYEQVRKLMAEEKKNFSYYLHQSAMRFLLTRLRDFELKEGPVKAKPFKDFKEYLLRFSSSLTLLPSR